MGRNIIEALLGAVVLAVAALFLVFAYNSSNMREVVGYNVSAVFPSIDGLRTGNDVRINGVKVGTVLSETLDKKSFLAEIHMSIDPEVKLPVDTMALVSSEGLLGGKFIALEIGVEDDTVKTDGTGRLTRTQPPIRFDDLIGQLIYSKNGSSSEPKKEAAPEAAHP